MMNDNIIWLDFNDAPEQRDELATDTDALRSGLLERLEAVLHYLFPQGRIRSGKFWLKTLSIGTLTVLALEGGARLALHQLIFNSDHIYRSAQTALDGTKRRIRFDADFGRSWFPRPTLTLHNVIISKPGTDTAEIHIREMKVGVAWKTLFGADPEIEKWLIKQADLGLSRQANGN